MKTYRNLYPQIAGFVNLDEAAEEGRRQAQGEEGVAQRRGHPPGGVEEQRLAAGEAGDEDLSLIHISEPTRPY